MSACVSITRLDGYDEFPAVERAIRQGLEPFGGMARFVQPGKKVLLKVNLVAPSRPELAVTTHPAIVRAVIRLVRECGGICFVGDGPGVGTTRVAAEGSGLMPLIEEEGATLLPFEETADYENEENRVMKRIPLVRQLGEMDLLITLPKLKTHCQMAYTGALKNQYGLVPGAAKGQYHFRFQNRDVLADFMVDINRTAHPALAIMDAVIGMEGPGPSGGTPRKIGAVVIGEDLAAVDTVCLSMIGLTPEEVPVSMAARRGNYGETSLEAIEVIGEPLDAFRISDYKLVRSPLNIMRILPLPRFILRWIRRQVAPAPRIDTSRCIRCRRCEKGCPVKPAAIQPLNEKRRVNDATCIRCYCCHEFCPVKAIELRRSWLMRIFNVDAICGAASRLLGHVAAFFRGSRR